MVALPAVLFCLNCCFLLYRDTPKMPAIIILYHLEASLMRLVERLRTSTASFMSESFHLADCPSSKCPVL